MTPPRSYLRQLPKFLVCSLLLAASLRAHAADFFDDSSELVLSGYRVVAVRPVESGRSEVDVEADLTNEGDATWLNAGATITAVPEDMEIVQMVLRFDTVPASGPVSSSNAWTLEVPDDKVDGLPDDFSAGRIKVRVQGFEIPAFVGPTFFLDAATDAVFAGWEEVGVNVMLSFTALTPLLDELSVGDVLLEDPLPGGYRSERGLSGLLPRKVVSKTVSDGGRVQLEGAIPLADDVLSATFSTDIGYSVETGETLDILNFQLGTKNCVDESHLPVDGTPKRECIFRGLPFRFNDLELSGGVTASGEIRLSAGISSIQVRFRGLKPSRIVADLELKYTATIELKAEAGVPFAKVDKTLWTVPLPIYTGSIGGVPVEVSLDIDFVAGAQCDLRAAAVTSISQSLTTGVLVGISDAEPVFEPHVEFVPFKFTPPHVRDSSGLHLKGWAGVDATLIINRVKGPFVRTTGYGLFQVTPLDDPWWTIEAGIDVTAGVRAGFQLPYLGKLGDFKEEKSHTWNFPLGTSPESPGGGDGGGGGAAVGEPRLAGENVRWATTLSNKSGVFGATKVHVLANGDSLLIAGGGVGVLARLTARGELLWQQSFGLAYLLNAHETPAGTIVVAGAFVHDLVLAELDADGSLLWQRTYEIDGDSQTSDFTIATDPAGELSLYVVGFSTYGSIANRDPCIYRFDATGRLLWAKGYVSPGSDSASGAHGAPDGGIVVVGSTSAPVGDDQGGLNGLIFRINPDGDLVWGTALATFWNGNFVAVSISPDGYVWASGNVQKTLRDDYPDIWVARLDLETGIGNNLLVAQDLLWEEYLDVDASLELPPHEKTAGGFTAHDTGFAIVPLGAGAVVAGRSGLGPNQTALAFRLDEGLGVQWLTLFDGPGEDLFTGADIAEDGIVLAGSTQGFNPEGGVSPRKALIQKVPFEGLLDYEPSWGVITRYAQPQLKEAAGLALFAPGGISRADVAYELSTLAAIPKPAPYQPATTTLLATKVGALLPDAPPPPEAPRFARGDCNADGSVQGISDALALLNFSFSGGAEPPCLAACDATGDGSLGGVTDAVYILGHFFVGGPPPAPPFPACGPGELPGDASLGCAAGAACAE
jgi:hypothetical protein